MVALIEGNAIASSGAFAVSSNIILQRAVKKDLTIAV
jgi:hypothetical protein